VRKTIIGVACAAAAVATISYMSAEDDSKSVQELLGDIQNKAGHGVILLVRECAGEYQETKFENDVALWCASEGKEALERLHKEVHERYPEQR